MNHSQSALMSSSLPAGAAFARGGAVLEEPRYAAAARRAADFLIARVYDAESGALLRRWRQGIRGLA